MASVEVGPAGSLLVSPLHRTANSHIKDSDTATKRGKDGCRACIAGGEPPEQDPIGVGVCEEASAGDTIAMARLIWMRLPPTAGETIALRS